MEPAPQPPSPDASSQETPAPDPLSASAPSASLNEMPPPVAAEAVPAPIAAVPAEPPALPLLEPPLFASPPPPPPPPIPPPEPVTHPIVFHGRTEEFFRIWIVNTLLTLLTFGVFFSWAKVRKRRYLRGSTELLGHRFDYRANPVRLLIGHVVVLLLFLGYSLFGVVYPWVRFGVLGLGVVLLPWIVVRSMTFNAHNTVYRGIRFRFHRSLSGAARVYLLEPILLPLSLGFYYPVWQRSKRAYAIENHRFGDSYFRFDAGTGRFYSTYVLGALIFGGALLVGAFILGALVVSAGGQQPTLWQMTPFFALYGFGFFLSRELIFARLFNHVWNHTRLDDHRFRANLDVGRWLGLQLANLGAIIASAGMLYPWAAMRAQRYAASCLVFVPAGPVDGIQRMSGTGGNATGDMAAEFIGIDFGL